MILTGPNRKIIERAKEVVRGATRTAGEAQRRWVTTKLDKENGPSKSE